MAASPFSCIYDHIHRSFRLAESNIIGNRIMEQIYRLEHKAEVLHKRVHIICSNISIIQLDLPWLHIPKSCYKVTNRSLSASWWTDKGRRGFLRNRKTYVINNLSSVICKIYVIHLNILRFSLNILSINIHILDSQYRFCFINRDINCTKKRRKVAGRIKCSIHQEGRNHHNYSSRKIHSACKIELQREHAHHDSRHLNNPALQWNEWHNFEFHAYVCFRCIINANIQLLIILSDKFKILCFCNTLYKFQYFTNHRSILIKLLLRYINWMSL